VNVPLLHLSVIYSLIKSTTEPGHLNLSAPWEHMRGPRFLIYVYGVCWLLDAAQLYHSRQ